jgi:hypothetical protein
LDPIDEVSMIEAPSEVEDTDSNDVAAEEVVDSVLQKMADIEINEEVQEEE